MMVVVIDVRWVGWLVVVVVRRWWMGGSVVVVVMLLVIVLVLVDSGWEVELLVVVGWVG